MVLTCLEVVLALKKATVEKLYEQWMIAISPVKINTVSFKEWMAATPPVTKIYPT